MDNIPNPPIITRMYFDSETFIFTHGIKVYNETFYFFYKKMKFFIENI